MIRIEIDLELAESHLQSATILQFRMAAPPFPRIVAEMEVDLFGEEVVGGFQDVIAGKDFAEGAGRFGIRTGGGRSASLLLLLLSQVLWQSF